MVNPIYLIAMFLFSAFLIALTDKVNRKLSFGLFYLTLTGGIVLTIFRFLELSGASDIQNVVYTAGFKAPLSIVLSFGIKETVMLMFINLAGLLSGIYFFQEFKDNVYQPLALFMLILLGANGLVMTRDIFNTFVFLEIISIATYALIGVKGTKESLAAGFKYMMAGGIASLLLLLGIIFVYKYTGTLNLDYWISANIEMSQGYQIAIFMLIMAVIIELKPFPANGWALDIYQSTHPGMGAIISSINTGALLFLLYKLIPVIPENMLTLISMTGLFSFILSNLVALRQNDAGRLLGYSSTAQTGLIIFVLTGLTKMNVPTYTIEIMALGLFVTNLFAKTGLFWLKGVIGTVDIKRWSVLRVNPFLLIMFIIFGLALAGLPPFPAFTTKWEIVKALAQSQSWWLVTSLLIGSLLEATYIFRWFGYTQKGSLVKTSFNDAFSTIIPVAISGLMMFLFALFTGVVNYKWDMVTLLPIVALLVFAILDPLPLKLKGFLAIAILGVWAWKVVYPSLSGIGYFFGIILVAGSIIQIFGFIHHKQNRRGLFPLLTMLIVALGNLLLAHSKMDFFIAWEMMTLAGYFMIMRGEKAEKPGLRFMVFSLAGAYAILTGLNLIPDTGLTTPFYQQVSHTSIGLLPVILLGIGFLLKMGAIGVHIWLPGAYAEAEDEFTAVLSSVFSKTGVLGLFFVLVMGKDTFLKSVYLPHILSWIGVLTAFFGALMAVFQEDVKKLLAYSSMGQLGYIILSFATFSHLGWTAALYMTMNHFLFKVLILMAIAGVLYRTKTRWMYEMGGLIKKMPISFISVLMGIIAVSGVPPLSGYGAKWLIYTSLIAKGFYLQAGLAFFSGAVSFLYLYKLIHTVFLGQAKTAHKDVKEAPIWLLIPQGIFIMLIMGISMFPNMITFPISGIVDSYIARPDWLTWDGYSFTLQSEILSGKWDGNTVMMVTMGVFMLPLLWLLAIKGKVNRVKQLNIVFAAERPLKPETTHFAHNMFAPYNKALGFLVDPRATQFWNRIREGVNSIGAMFAHIYTGDGQTYLLHIFLYILGLYFLGGIR